MSINLFSFDFTEEINGLITEERILEKFKELQDLFKENCNGYYYPLEELPNDMMIYIDEFEKKGWIEKRGKDGINILDEYLAHYTPEEVIERYKQKVNEALSQPNVSWYENILPVVNHTLLPIRYKNETEKEQIHQMRLEVIKDTVKKLGLKHFLEVPSSRGYKLNPFTSKWSRENVIPMIAKKIIPITDFDEMKSFFDNHLFFMGRKDWDKRLYRDGYEIPPYPVFKKIIPGYFAIACLCEAKDEQTIKLILDYSGTAYGYSEKTNPNLTILFPEGWSMERYQATLTDKDKKLIKEDQERIKRLLSPNN